MKKRFAKYIALKRKVNNDIISREDQVRSNPDPYIDQDFPGFPDAPSTDAMIDPKTKWMKLANIHPTGNEKFKDMIPQMLWNLLVQFVTAFVLAVIYLFASSSPYIGEKRILGGIILAIWLWLGFLVTSSSIEVIWMGRNYKLWLYEVVSSLIIMVTMGAIIASW